MPRENHPLHQPLLHERLAVSMQLTQSKPLCPTHKPNPFDFSGDASLFKLKGGLAGELTARCERWDVRADAFKYLWLDDIVPLTHTVSPSSCGVQPPPAGSMPMTSGLWSEAPKGLAA